MACEDGYTLVGKGTSAKCEARKMASDEEVKALKENAQKTIREMQAFSKKHFLTIMKGDYSNFTKLTCLLSQSKSAPAMWIGYYLGNFKKVFKDRKYRMFD